MYPPRSQKHQAEKKTRKKKQGRLWGTINISLLVVIVVLFSYHFITQKKDAGEGNQSPNMAANIADTGPNETSSEKSPGTDTDRATQGEQEPDKKTDTASSEEQGSSGEDEAEQDAGKQQEVQQPDLGKQQEVQQQPDSGKNIGTTVAVGGSPSGQDTLNNGQKNGDSAVESGKSVTIHFVGDMIFSGKVETLLEKKGYSYPYHYLGDMFKKDDLTLGNLETPVTTRGVGATNKTYVFKSSPKALYALRAAGMDAVNLANNHILDQGNEGLLDTIHHLDQSGINYVGAGKNSGRAYAPQYFERNGMTIALVGASRVYPESNWAAGTDKPGVASAYDKAANVMKSIAEARKNADMVIVMAHWGIERQSTPDAYQKTLAHAFIDAGADLIIGSHPHVLQGMEQYKGKWIAYSTGNFIFTKSTVPATWKTAVFKATCSPKGGCGMKLIPFKTELGQPVPMSQDESRNLMQEVQGLSIGGVKVAEDGTVTPNRAP